MTDKPKSSFQIFCTVGLAIDPIHVGTGGARLGRVDNTIVRDPVTRIPKIPGSSLAGVHRAYAAMALEDERKGDGERHYYPSDAGSTENDGRGPINAVFGHKKFAGLAAFSDAHLVFFPVASRDGPVWVTSPSALKAIGATVTVDGESQNKAQHDEKRESVILGWLQLEAESWVGFPSVKGALKAFGVREHLYKKLNVVERLVLVSDKLFGHIVNNNLEVRTSVAINPETGAAEDGALFTYEAIPRGAILAWDVTCRDPRHFNKDRDRTVSTTKEVHDVVAKAHPFLAALGVGGMGTRGMGRLEVLAFEVYQ
ncbi:MAG: type III-B CRISPR module RAMP protein Cmr4 [Polyangiaceae bacterium]|nr:type III-B CRISPR module RAMP protein Cmr4 [Polyangiaceae bacterium]